MRLGRRRVEVPAAVVGALPRGERILAAAEGEDGLWLVGTRDHLYAVDPGQAPTAWPWERVHRAAWDRDTRMLRVERVVDFGEPVDVRTFGLVGDETPTALLGLVNERVTASIVLQRRVDVVKRTGFTVVGRRAPRGDGPVEWACEFDAGLDPSDPGVAAQAEVALQDARESLGL